MQWLQLRFFCGVLLGFCLQGATEQAVLQSVRALLQAQQVDRAHAVLLGWCQNQPQQAERWLQATRLILNAGQPAAAELFAQQAARLLSGNEQAQGYYATCLLLSGRESLAEVHLKQAVERIPGSAELYFQLGMACSKNQKLLAAQNAYQEALARQPNHLLTHFWIAENYLRLLDYPAAVQHLEAVLRQPKPIPDARWKLAETLGYQAKDGAAEEMFGRALKVDAPRSRLRAALHYAQFLFERDRLLEAKPLLHEVTQQWPEHRTAWYYLARCERRLGDRQAAKTALKTYQQLQQREDQMHHEALLAQLPHLQR
jgi:predicted Zn-dependent protease